MNKKPYSLEDLKKMKSQTDVERFKKTTEQEIREQSILDPDTPYLTEKELKEMKPAKNKREKRGKENK